MFNLYAKKQIVKQITSVPIPFPYELIYYNEEEDCETNDIVGSIIYVNITITPDACNVLKNPYKTQIYFSFPDTYPFTGPVIMLEDAIYHELVIMDGEKINLCDYGVMMTFPQLIMNVYCIILEALYNNQNNDLINYINHPTKQVIEFEQIEQVTESELIEQAIESEIIEQVIEAEPIEQI